LELHYSFNIENSSVVISNPLGLGYSQGRPACDSMNPKDNIILIGMPGAGKSTIGVLLAKAARREFIDSDLLLQARQGKSLGQIIEDSGIDRFLRLEEQCLLNLGGMDSSVADVPSARQAGVSPARGHVIATGGSAIYSDLAMTHLAAGGTVIYLHVPLAQLRKRLGDFASRGVVMSGGQTLEQLYEHRLPLYRKWANHIIDCSHKTHEEIVADILALLSVP
jgi:shikimate kinase